MPNATFDQTAPATGAVSVTPSNTDNLADGSCRALWIGGAGSGNLSVLMADGTTGVFSGVPGGLLLPISVLRVNLTGTDVTGIVALY